ncbi:unnamed protein product [Linum trigynum]|uniref:Uncharacterized protein n=1 Tax=Linum trigynum TaxID=586398 RepID=A0AAV2DHG8_9ROSI
MSVGGGSGAGIKNVVALSAFSRDASGGGGDGVSCLHGKQKGGKNESDGITENWTAGTGENWPVPEGWEE